MFLVVFHMSVTSEEQLKTLDKVNMLQYIWNKMEEDYNFCNKV